MRVGSYGDAYPCVASFIKLSHRLSGRFFYQTLTDCLPPKTCVCNLARTQTWHTWSPAGSASHQSDLTHRHIQPSFLRAPAGSAVREEEQRAPQQYPVLLLGRAACQ